MDPGPILIILQSPVYFLALFTLLAYYYCFPLDTLITFVSSKPVRLTTSSQVGSKVFVCVCAGSTNTFSRLSRLSCSINLGFLTEGKLAATHIIPSSWGSQLAGQAPRTRTSATHPHHRQQLFFWRRCRGGEKTSARGVLRTHILCFVICFALLYFIYLHCFYIKNPKKIRILGSCYFFTLSLSCWSLSTFWRTSQ